MSCNKYKQDYNLTEQFIILSFNVYNYSNEDEIVDTLKLTEGTKNIFREYINVSFLNEIKDYGFYLTVHHIIFIDNSIDVIASYIEKKEEFSEFDNLNDFIDSFNEKSIMQVEFSNGEMVISDNSGEYKFNGLVLTHCE